MDVQHVIVGFRSSSDSVNGSDSGYIINESTLEILNALDPDFLLGYQPTGKSHGASSLEDTSLRTLIRTFFEDTKLAPPPAAINGQILSRVWTTDTEDFTQDMALRYLQTVYFDSHHRAYHARLPIDTLRGLTARNSVSFARPSFLHLPLSFTDPETRDQRPTVFLSDYLLDIFHVKKPDEKQRYEYTRTAHILSWHLISDKVGIHESIAELLAYYMHSPDIVDLFTENNNVIDRLTLQLRDIRIAIVCLDKFNLLGTYDQSSNDWN